ncbi:MAG TPA: hypothetical protein VMH86_06190 [Rhizomicrobium sp.]|nr:hypothetical protein [Rhizomicrobium sp.]
MGQVDRFLMLYGSTFKFTDIERRFLGGVGAHFNKAITLQGLALRIKPGLETDNREMRERGHSPGLNAQELSAVIEATILELYSCVDCVAEVIFAIYRHKHIRHLKQTTSGMYRDFESFGRNFPDEIRAALRSTTWFQELRTIRDELTHRQTGTVNLDEKTGLVFYMHHGMKQGDRALIIDDIFVWLGAIVEAVNRFLGQLFHYLNSQLLPGQVDVVCGFTQGRILMRIVNPAEELTFNSGICRSYTWFQQPGNPGCPFSKDCGAFKRTQTQATAGTSRA